MTSHQLLCNKSPLKLDTSENSSDLFPGSFCGSGIQGYQLGSSHSGYLVKLTLVSQILAEVPSEDLTGIVWWLIYMFDSGSLLLAGSFAAFHMDFFTGLLSILPAWWPASPVMRESKDQGWSRNAFHYLALEGTYSHHILLATQSTLIQRLKDNPGVWMPRV